MNTPAWTATAAKEPDVSADADTPRWLSVTWYGGNNNADSDVRGRTLSVNTSTAAFNHPARVRRRADGTVEGYWLNNGEWTRFVGEKIPAALIAIAEKENPA